MPHALSTRVFSLSMSISLHFTRINTKHSVPVASLAYLSTPELKVKLPALSPWARGAMLMTGYLRSIVAVQGGGRLRI